LHIGLLIVVILPFLLGNRFGRAFPVIIAANYLLAIGVQTMVATENYGFVVVTPMAIWYLVAACIWLWEAFIRKVDYTVQKLPLTRYWVVPIALFAFWDPDQLGNIHISMFLNSPSPTTFCMITTIYLAVFCLFFPNINLPAFRITSFLGLVPGGFTLILAMVRGGRDGFYWGAIHIPMLVLSAYCFYIGMRPQSRETGRSHWG
jgi:hypothetical protein